MNTTKAIPCLVGSLLISLACAVNAQGQITAVVLGDPGSTDNDSDDVVGFIFTVADEPITVVELGFWDAGSNGLNSAHDVGIFRQFDMELMVEGTVEAGTDSPLDDQFRYVSVPETILEAGESYQAVSYRPAGTTDLVGVEFMPGMPAEEIFFSGGIFQNGTGGLAFASTNPNVDIFGANFKFLTSQTELIGDLNDDEIVDDIDFRILASNYGTETGANPDEGDLTGESNVGLVDVIIFQEHFGETVPAASAAAVPEPSSLMLLIMASAGFFAWSARRSRF